MEKLAGIRRSNSGAHTSSNSRLTGSNDDAASATPVLPDSATVDLFEAQCAKVATFLEGKSERITHKPTNLQQLVHQFIDVTSPSIKKMIIRENMKSKNHNNNNDTEESERHDRDGAETGNSDKNNNNSNNFEISILSREFAFFINNRSGGSVMEAVEQFFLHEKNQLSELATESRIVVIDLGRYFEANITFLNDIFATKVPVTFFDFARQRQQNYSTSFLRSLEQPVLYNGATGLSDDRMINLDVAVNAGSLLRHREDADAAGAAILSSTGAAATLEADFDSGTVTFIGGTSGSGKTGTSIVALGRKCIVVYSQPGIASREDLIDNNHKYDLAREVLFECVGEAVQSKVVTNSTSSGSVAVDESKMEKQPSSRWNPLPDDNNIHIILDEASNHPVLCSALCNAWKEKCRRNLANYFNCKENQLFLTVVGTGIENLENARGSQPGTYQVFSIRSAPLFIGMLTQLSEATKRYLTPIADSLLELLFVKDAGKYVASPQSPLEYAVLQLCMTSARCAALLLDELRQLARNLRDGETWTTLRSRNALRHVAERVMSRFGRMNGLAQFTSSVAASKLTNLPAEEQQVILARAGVSPRESLTGELGKRVAHELRSHVVGKALKFSMSLDAAGNPPSTVDAELWMELGASLGLIDDTAFWTDRTSFNAKPDKFERVTDSTNNSSFIEMKVLDNTNNNNNNNNNNTTTNAATATATTTSSSKTFYFVFHKNSPRFRVPEAFVVMYLTNFGRDQSYFSSDANWKQFESSIALYAALCAQLRLERGPEKKIKKTYGSNTLEFTVPRYILCPPEKKPVSVLFRGVLPHPFSEEIFNQPNSQNVTTTQLNEKLDLKKWLDSQKETWKSVVTRGCEPTEKNQGQQQHQQQQQQQQQKFGMIILENVGNTAFADVIILLPGRVTLVQCKYYLSTSMTKKDVDAAFTTHEDKPEALKFLQECCCVEGNNWEDVEIWSVLAGADSRSVASTADVTSPKRGVTRFVTLPFENKGSSEALMYPVLQFPLVERQNARGNLSLSEYAIKKLITL
jgi:hypothetical protein